MNEKSIDSNVPLLCADCTHLNSLHTWVIKQFSIGVNIVTDTSYNNYTRQCTFQKCFNTLRAVPNYGESLRVRVVYRMPCLFVCQRMLERRLRVGLPELRKLQGLLVKRYS